MQSNFQNVANLVVESTAEDLKLEDQPCPTHMVPTRSLHNFRWSTRCLSTRKQTRRTATCAEVLRKSKAAPLILALMEQCAELGSWHEPCPLFDGWCPLRNGSDKDG